MTRKIPEHRTLESENWDRMTDNVLNSVLSGIRNYWRIGRNVARATSVHIVDTEETGG